MHIGSDINASDCHGDNNLIATGDDFGLVKIFNYPSVQVLLSIIFGIIYYDYYWLFIVICT